jgi:6-pyruvoyltetrahydropterin/6-carboxytetrahydropterin synthase
LGRLAGPERDQNSAVTIRRSRRRGESAFSTLPDLMPHLAVAPRASSVTHSDMIEPRGPALYSIIVSHHFMIAHSLVGAVFGPAQQLRGATFVVEAELRRDTLDAYGIVCDIGRALDLLKTVHAEFDYRDLDELAEFRERNTATEFLACEVHKRLARRIKEDALESQAITSFQAITSLRVVLRENPVAWAAYDAPLG